MENQTTRIYFNKVMRMNHHERNFLISNFNWIYPAPVAAVVSDFRLLMSRLQDMSNAVGKHSAMRYVGLHSNPDRGVNQIFESLTFLEGQIELSINELEASNSAEIEKAIQCDLLDGTPATIISYLNDTFLESGSVSGRMCLPNGVHAAEFVYSLCELIEVNAARLAIVNMTVEFDENGKGVFSLAMVVKDSISHAFMVSWKL